MYKQEITDNVVFSKGRSDIYPVATLADEYGGRCQIAIDDHCYVLYLKRDDGYILTSHIFREAFEVLRSLPDPK